ncbi:unnamed protein product [Prorocentrum cordatum]|uniref:Uncharacterized protein n=1 Tax=Prorocentrum cordatum TaxID=2364126 RepID=A0ABN9R254_9DINO|nr:unnamed protein product [Polarella glacialis]
MTKTTRRGAWGGCGRTRGRRGQRGGRRGRGASGEAGEAGLRERLLQGAGQCGRRREGCPGGEPAALAEPVAGDTAGFAAEAGACGQVGFADLLRCGLEMGAPAARGRGRGGRGGRGRGRVRIGTSPDILRRSSSISDLDLPGEQMAEVAADEVPQAEKDELFCAYAAMILKDSELDISEENLTTLIKAAGGSIESFFPALFAKMCQGKDAPAMVPADRDKKSWSAGNGRRKEVWSKLCKGLHPKRARNTSQEIDDFLKFGGGGGGAPAAGGGGGGGGGGDPAAEKKEEKKVEDPRFARDGNQQHRAHRQRAQPHRWEPAAPRASPAMAEHVMRATEHTFGFNIANGAARMKVECYLKDVEGGQWLSVEPPVGAKEWPLFPTAQMLMDELEEKFSFYTGKKISLYRRAMHVNGQVRRDGEAYEDWHAINQNAAKYGIYVQVDSFALPAGDWPGARDMRGGAGDGRFGDGVYLSIYILDGKFKGWWGVELVSSPVASTVTCEELKAAILDKLRVASKSDRKVASVRIYKNNFEHAPKPTPVPTTDRIKVNGEGRASPTFTAALNPSLKVETTDGDSLGSSWAAADDIQQ